ncbi:MAG: hypothetical protein Q7R50_06620 [Dehalococcoidales bacterium]|nr:hypothetical protein [Dehalococcoidales bacterium]
MIKNKVAGKWSLKAAVSMAAGIALVLASYVPVQAAPPPPIDLILGGEGATAWNFANIKPGDYGTKIVSLRNAGTSDGMITIWISDLVNTRISGADPKYAGLTGELADYLRLNASSRGLEANVALPAPVTNYPRTSTGPYYVRVNPLRAGETINMTWRWELPAQTGNNVQGKGTSFTLNYMLEELPPPEPPAENEPMNPAPPTPQNPPVTQVPDNPPVTPPPTPPATPVPEEPPVTPKPTPVIPPPPSLPTVVPPIAPALEIPPATAPVMPEGGLSILMINSPYALKTDASGIVQQTAKLSDKAGNFVIDIAKGTRVTDPDGIAIDTFELAVVNQSMQELVSIPSGTVPVGPIYTIVGYRNGKRVSRVNFEPYVTLTLAYDPKGLPENALTPFVVNFVKDGKLIKLASPPGAIFESGKVKATAYHASYFGLAAEVLPEAPLPPHFRVAGLQINPGQARPGQTIAIIVEIANDGATAGTYEMHLIIDGVVRAVKDVSMEPNSISTLTFEVADLAPGKHQVSVAGVTGEFRITDAVVSVPGTPIDWSLVDITVAGLLVSGLLITFLVIARLQRADRNSK